MVWSNGTYFRVDPHVRPRAGASSGYEQRVGSSDSFKVSDVVHFIPVHQRQQVWRAADVDDRFVTTQPCRTNVNLDHRNEQVFTRASVLI